MKIALLVFTALEVLPSSCFADEWPELQKKRYYSANRNYYADVFPALRRHKDSRPCYVRVYEKRAGTVIFKWQQSLLNEEAPADVVVAPDGNTIVGLDNWYSIGVGANVFVAYGAKGRLGKSYQLKDFSPFPISEFPRSASSISWSCGVQYMGNTKVRVCCTNRLNERKYTFYNLVSAHFESY